MSGPLANISQSPPGNPNASVSGLLAGTFYTFRYTIDSVFGCPSTFDDVIVKNGSPTLMADAGRDTALCGITSVRLNGSVPGADETGTWTIISGPTGATFSPNNKTPNALLNNITQGNYVLRWTISNGVCSNADLVSIDVFSPVTPANAGVDKIACFGKTLLQANSPTNGTGRWSQISGPSFAVIENEFSPTTEVSELNLIGEYYFVWTISNGTICSVNRDTVVIKVSSPIPSIANAGIDLNFCQQSSVNLAASQPSSGNGLWTQLSGNTVAILNPTQHNSLVNDLIPGEYIFEWKVSNTDNTCFTTDTVKVINHIKPNVPFAGDDKIQCLSTPLILEANQPVTGASGNWSVTSGPNTPIILSPHESQTQITGVIPGTYIFKWSISGDYCPTTSDEVELTILQNVNQALAGQDATICTDNYILNANSPLDGNMGSWTQISGPSSGSINICSNTPQCELSNLSVGTYLFEWKISNAGCSSSDSIKIVVHPKASVFAGDDLQICKNSGPVQLSGITLSNASSATWSIVSGNGILSNYLPTSNPQFVYFTPDNNYEGVVIIRLTTSDACSIVSDDRQIRLLSGDVNIIAIDDYATTNSNQEVSIFAINNDLPVNSIPVFICRDGGILTYPNYGTLNQMSESVLIYSPRFGFSGIDSFQYQLCADTAITLCGNNISSAWVYITVIDDICTIPNTFTPNGDGLNDYFVLPCIDYKIEFSVYNKWGVELFTDSDYQNQWNGNYKGSPLPEGTYYYTISYRDSENKLIQKAGFISLRR